MQTDEARRRRERGGGDRGPGVVVGVGAFAAGGVIVGQGFVGGFFLGFAALCGGGAPFLLHFLHALFGFCLVVFEAGGVAGGFGSGEGGEGEGGVDAGGEG